MTTADPDTETAFGGWDSEKLIEAVAGDEAGGSVYRVDGVSASVVQRDFSRLRRSLAEEGRLALALDPSGGPADGASFREATAAYASRVRERQQLDTEVGELVEFLASARRPTTEPHHGELSGRAVKNALCRLWRSLSEHDPATLFIFRGSQASATERRALCHFISEFFVDPVSEFVPELGEPNRIESSLVYVDTVPEAVEEADLEVETVDVSETARSNIRERLTSDNVVDQFIATTGGDPRQLDALLESLPDDCESLWTYRYRRLDRPEQQLLELLAVSGEPLSIECLRRSFEAIGAEGEFSQFVRRLNDEGFVDRQIEAGTVRLQLEDGGFQRALRGDLAASDRAVLHGVLAESALNAQLDEADDRFLAEHFLAAGRVERGFEFGMRAARGLYGEHALEEACELFERLLDCATDASDIREIRSYLLDIHTALGNHEEALECVAELKKGVEDAEDWGRLVCKEGKIHVQSGAYDEADERFEAVCESVDRSRAPGAYAAAVFGRAEGLYLRGRQEKAGELVERAVDQLEEATEEATQSPSLGRTLVKAKNLKGRIQIVRGNLTDARSLFETNQSVARSRGWKRESNRAEINLAVVELQQGDYVSALEKLRELRNRTPGPESSQRAILLINLGVAAQHDQSYEEALDHYRGALREARRANFQWGIDVAAYNLASALEDLGAYDQVLDVLRRLERRQNEDRRSLFIGRAPRALRAKALMEAGEPSRALEIFGQLGEDVTDDDVSAGTRAHAVLHSAHAHLRLGQVDQATEVVDSYDAPDEVQVRECPEGLELSARAAIALEKEAYEEAEGLARDASELLRDAGYFGDSVRAATIRVRSLRQLGRTGEAESVIRRRLEAFQSQADSIPDRFRSSFFSIPAYRELVELSREITGETPEPYQKYVEVSEEPVDSGDEQLSDEAYQKWRSKYSEIIGEDERLLKIFRRVDQVADSDAPVLIQGASGTGKELVADAIHEQGREAEDAPFVKVNCGAFVDNLLLSELFGHEKGAFTGAVEEKVGRFERADGGTIFLDEIGEISKKAQVALLRVLQEGEFERVGGTETLRVDVRVICATNQDLEAAVESGEFRLDLYYRLKGILLELPPLRDRKQDIPRLVRHFAKSHVPDGGTATSFSRDVMEFLASYTWPGNIRELKNFVRSILLFVDGDTVEMEHLRDFRDFFSEGEVDLDPPDIDYDVPAEEYGDLEDEAAGEVFEDAEDALVQEIVSDGRDLSELKERIEYESICRALRETGGNITQAAEILKMTRPRLSQIVNSDDDLVELKEKLVG